MIEGETKDSVMRGTLDDFLAEYSSSLKIEKNIAYVLKVKGKSVMEIIESEKKFNVLVPYRDLPDAFIDLIMDLEEMDYQKEIRLRLKRSRY